MKKTVVAVLLIVGMTSCKDPNYVPPLYYIAQDDVSYAVRKEISKDNGCITFYGARMASSNLMYGTDRKFTVCGSYQINYQ